MRSNIPIYKLPRACLLAAFGLTSLCHLGCGGGGGGSDDSLENRSDTSISAPQMESVSDGLGILSSRNEDPIQCDGGGGLQQILLDAPEEDVMIDGGGREVCLLLQGACSGTLRARSLVFTNCSTCIGVADNSQLEVIATQTGIFCDSSGDAVQAARGGRINLRAPEDIVLISTGRGHGVRTQDGGSVSLSSNSTCFIEGQAGPVRAEGGPVDLSNCREVIQLPTSVEDQFGPELGTGEINAPLPDEAAPTASPDAENTETQEIDGNSLPLSCNSGTLIFDEPESDLVIDGERRTRCIIAERGCVASIRAKSITLTNCRGCIEASRDASIELNAVDGDIRCDSIRDAVRVETGAEASLQASGDIVVSASGSSTSEGLRAEADSIIRLETEGMCSITGVETAVLATDNGRIELEACGTLSELPLATE